MTKDQIRKKYRTERNKLSEADILVKSAQIFKRVSNLSVLKKAENISLYLPVNNEVETKDLIDYLVSKDKKVFLPRYAIRNTSKVGFDSFEVNKDVVYSFAEFTGWENLERGPFGILQPIDQQSLRAKRSNQDLDVAIVPGVAFDKKGVRLGYGKGVYDRLFEKSNAFKIGLCYDFQIADKLPKEKHDLVMNIVVTDKRILVI